ncbi:MAG TPA: hypothetical protein VGD16_02360 [Enterovirga sp.]
MLFVSSTANLFAIEKKDEKRTASKTEKKVAEKAEKKKQAAPGQDWGRFNTKAKGDLEKYEKKGKK